MAQKKYTDANGEIKQDLPASTEENVTTTPEDDLRAENLMESDLEDKTPAGDRGPEDEV